MKVKILSQKDALVYSESVGHEVIIISIVGEKDSPLQFEGTNVKDVFRMFYEDIERPYGNSKMPQREDFIGLKDFLDRNMNIPEIIIHCYQGCSRSSACASAVLRYLHMDDNFIWASANYSPNSLVFKYATEELCVQLDAEYVYRLYKTNSEAHMMASEFILS